MDELIKAINVLEQRSWVIIDSLEGAAESARSFGMDRLAGRSEKQIEMIRSAVDDISKASSVALQESFRRAEQGSANMILAALAVASRKRL